MNNKIPPPIVTLVFGLAIYFSKPLFPYFSNVILNVLSLLLIIVGPLTLISAARSFKAQQTTINPINIDKATSLVVSGVFKYSRNPMYLGLIFLQLSLGILLSMVHIMLMCIFTYIIFKYYVIKPEEKYLSSKFGDDYNDYKSKVRRWI